MTIFKTTWLCLYGVYAWYIVFFSFFHTQPYVKCNEITVLVLMHKKIDDESL